jgi:hypothetical protein
MGLIYTPRRSTLADANQRRTSDFFSALYHQLYQHHYGILPDSLKGRSIKNRLFIVDSTTITLFSSVMRGMGSYGHNGKKKGGAKAHMLVKASDQVPCFVHISEAKENDKIFLPLLALPKGSVVVMDRGYNSYKQLIRWSVEEIMWVTRLHPSSVWSVSKYLPVSEQQRERGIVEDTLIDLGNPKKVHINPIQKVRLVRFIDPIEGKEFLFISNNLTIDALTIADIYKQRWDIELLFKRVKQNFNLHDFLGDNENAIKIQIWCGLIADLLIKIIKDKVDKQRKRKWSFANLAGLIRQHLTTYINLIEFLTNPEKAMLQYTQKPPTTQLLLYST